MTKSHNKFFSKYDTYMIKLSKLKQNQSAKIVEVDGEKKIKQRLLQLGFTTGQIVRVLGISALKKSFLIGIRNYTLALRKESIELIGVELI